MKPVVVMRGRGAAASGGSGAFFAVSSFSDADGSTISAGNRYGWVFTPTVNKSCNTLRLRYSSAGGGVANRVIVHRNSDNVVVAQADIVMSASGVWTKASTAPFSLFAGVAYTISSCPIGGANQFLRRDNTVTVHPEIIPASNVDSVSGGVDNNRPTSIVSGRRYRHCDFGFE